METGSCLSVFTEPETVSGDLGPVGALLPTRVPGEGVWEEVRGKTRVEDGDEGRETTRSEEYSDGEFRRAVFPPSLQEGVRGVGSDGVGEGSRASCLLVTGTVAPLPGPVCVWSPSPRPDLRRTLFRRMDLVCLNADPSTATAGGVGVS